MFHHERYQALCIPRTAGAKFDLANSGPTSSYHITENSSTRLLLVFCYAHREQRVFTSIENLAGDNKFL